MEFAYTHLTTYNTRDTTPKLWPFHTQMHPMPKRRAPVDDALNQQLEQAVRASRQTISALAVALGCDRKTLYKWLDGTNAIPRDKLQRLCDLIHLPQEQRGAQFAGRGYPVHQAHVERAHHLRAPVRDFVGRGDELYQIVAALSDVSQAGATASITGVRGMGGVGKTELAFRVAQRLAPMFPDGQVVIALHGAGTTPLTPEQALQTVLRAVDPLAKLPENLDELQNRYRSQLHNSGCSSSPTMPTTRRRCGPCSPRPAAPC